MKLRGGALRPLADAAWIPSEVVPAIRAPAMAPAMAPRGPTHGNAIPRVKIPHVALAAMAESAVATPVRKIILYRQKLL